MKIQWLKFLILFIKGMIICLVLFVFLSIYPFHIDGLISTIIIQLVLIPYTIWKGIKIIDGGNWMDTRSIILLIVGFL